ncbi:MAG: TIGR01212 family radical SAM protein [Thermodesulfobacteriota bacterium]
MKEGRRYYPLSEYLKERFGCRVYRVTLDGGFTCPTRDGTKGTGGCTYCEPATLVPKDHKDGASIGEQLAVGMEKVRKRHGVEKFIAYFQVNTNTYANTERLRVLYTEATSHPDVLALAVSTRPDCLGDEVLDLLAELKGGGKHLWLEMGLQSSSDRTLERIGRGHTAGEFSDAAWRARARGIEVCAHVIFGLPGEGREKMLDTVKFISRLPVWGIKFHQLDVVKGTALEKEYNGKERNDDELKLLSLDEYAGLVVESLELLPPRVVVHRLSGATPRELLVAPRWSLKRSAARNRIEKLLIEENTRQGANFQAP